ncbi:Eukaryotic/viral aspartic protease, partial [Phytophthora megakarya]
KGSNSAVPETPAKTDGADDYDTKMLVETPGTDEYTGRSGSFEKDAHEFSETMEEDYDLEEKEDIPEDAILSAGRSGGARPLSTWIRPFEPKRIRQAGWADLSHKLAVAVTATTTGQVASDTVQFMKSMGLQAQTVPTQAVLESWIPAEAGADLWKWKRKLRVGFGVTDIHYPQPPVG